MIFEHQEEYLTFTVTQGNDTKQFKVNCFKPSDLDKILDFLDNFAALTKCSIEIEECEKFTEIFNMLNITEVHTLQSFLYYLKLLTKENNKIRYNCLVETLGYIYIVIKTFKITSFQQLRKKMNEILYSSIIYQYHINDIKNENDEIWKFLISQGINKSPFNKLVFLGFHVIFQDLNEDIDNILSGKTNLITFSEEYVLHDKVYKYLGEYLKENNYPSNVKLTPIQLVNILFDLGYLELIYGLIDLKKVGQTYLKTSNFDQEVFNLKNDIMCLVYWF